MSVGFGQLLTHLPTKYSTRRSDIIVSSTLSITLIPSDPEYRVKDLCLIKDEEIDRWVDIRSIYRASKVSTANRHNDNRSELEAISPKESVKLSLSGGIRPKGEPNAEGKESNQQDQLNIDENPEE